jgi:hypothetical protein
LDAELAVDCLDKGGDRAVPGAVKIGKPAIDGHLCSDLVALAAGMGIGDDLVRPGDVEVLTLKLDQ